jgi:hypothetical protein
MDDLTRRRLLKFVESYRKQTGQLPTLKEFEMAGFHKTIVEKSIKLKVLEQFYITLTSGTIVKVYKEGTE